ncbi:MAG: GIY-YIG nuclease family protein [Candidatus Sungbacteria bacterium]|uniref:GIY-YIG nuclease family protein n=1 Tax=Candidatus Sungiibacteriota bacterium TaxID=2750080 RepID=A0A9D6LRQ7_9BACT|nr:GIY-YIG nuclease family protein [Candidatus Sungbacteria bacterium]
MHGVYVLRSKKDLNLYVGYAHDLKARVIEHQKGHVPATKNRRPLELIYCELHRNRKGAMHREKFFKSGWGRNYLQKVLQNSLKDR